MIQTIRHWRYVRKCNQSYLRRNPEAHPGFTNDMIHLWGTNNGRGHYYVAYLTMADNRVHLLEYNEDKSMRRPIHIELTETDIKAIALRCSEVDKK